MPLPSAVYSASQVRDFDARAIAAGTPGYTLMKRAGEAALRALRTRWPRAVRIAIVCGGGNNGGDGYVMARFAGAAGLSVRALSATPPDTLRGDARRAYDDALASGCDITPFETATLEASEVIVDALLGTGTQLPLREAVISVIEAINAAGRPVLSLDLPSGLDATNGAIGTAVVRADVTVTFVALKSGLYCGQGPEFAGQVACDELDVPTPDDALPMLQRLDDRCLLRALPRRPRNSHKAEFGRVLVIGGGSGMPGAVRLAAEAALRVGAGLVTVASRPEHLAAIVGPCPELMFAPLPDVAPLPALVAAADVVVLGPGLGRSAWSQMVFDAVMATRREGQPLLLDADALNLLAADQEPPTCADWILTPHPGEAARLLGLTATEVQADRLGALAQLVATRGGRVVLKGAGTLIGSAGAVPQICERGNPGMAIPGMGDVLSGTIAGVLGQCRDVDVAVAAAVFAHASAGDAVARGGERGILASDVIRELRNWVNR
ncbi:MAG: NAD(P)H-hydrate dehydratase [Steroidobacteraceae bacterium]